ncbi:hypothetical protein O3G_MSEX007211 [Manduca sexta]|uniref:Uncharacterized protein n=1 Tax=Manduca sexta TaxID=7130 RepID=A0A922CMM9_MANSE|nr:hypothetical protein O3G_MSEX007211 [Manduca sexta]
MKALLLLFLTICVHQITCQDKKILVKTLPKKVKPYSKVQILNPGKAYKMKTLVSKDSKKYTAFPVITVRKNIKVPDSLYFAQEMHVGQKPRVKKVLPDYVWTSLRSKRSADVKEKADNKPNEHKVHNHKRFKNHGDGNNAERGKKTKSKRGKHRKLVQRTREVKNKDDLEKTMKYTKKSGKRKVKRSGRKGPRKQRGNRKENLRNRKSRKVSKKSLSKGNN